MNESFSCAISWYNCLRNSWNYYNQSVLVRSKSRENFKFPCTLVHDFWHFLLSRCKIDRSKIKKDCWEFLILSETLQNGLVSGLLISVLEKVHFWFNLSNNSGAIDVTIDGYVLEEKPSFKMLGLSFSPKLHWGS